MKNIKLLVFDIDGTLIPRGVNYLEDSTKQAINKAVAKDIKVLISTGRCSYLIQKDALESIDSDYIVTINGALICDHDLNTLFESRIDENLFKRINDKCKEMDLAVGYKFEKNIAVYHKYEYYSSIYLSGNKHSNVLNYEKSNDYHLKYGMPCGVFIIGENDKLQEFSSFFNELTWVVAYDKAIEGFNLGISKASGIKYVLNELNLSFDNVMCFGDSQNDIEMISDAAIGVAMGNATKEVKAIADYITTDCGDNGIYNALKHFNII